MELVLGAADYRLLAWINANANANQIVELSMR